MPQSLPDNNNDEWNWIIFFSFFAFSFLVSFWQIDSSTYWWMCRDKCHFVILKWNILQIVTFFSVGNRWQRAHIMASARDQYYPTMYVNTWKCHQIRLSKRLPLGTTAVTSIWFIIWCDCSAFVVCKIDVYPQFAFASATTSIRVHDYHLKTIIIIHRMEARCSMVPFTLRTRINLHKCIYMRKWCREHTTKALYRIKSFCMTLYTHTCTRTCMLSRHPGGLFLCLRSFCIY